MEINLSKDYKEQEQTPLGFEEPEKPAAGFEYEVSRDDGNAFCTQCGQAVNGAAFCPHCGHKVGNGGYQHQQSNNTGSAASYAGYSAASNMNMSNPNNVNYNYQPTPSTGGKERSKIVAILLAVFSCGILSALYDGDTGRLIRNIVLTCCGIGGLAMILDILKIVKYSDTYYV